MQVDLTSLTALRAFNRFATADFAETLGIEGIEVKDGICSDIPMEFTESPGGEAVISV